MNSRGSQARFLSRFIQPVSSFVKMYDIRQFKPALYALVILGITGFALATQLPEMWVLANAAILLNAWLVKTGRFQPLPRLVANGATVVGVLLMLMFVRRGGVTPIIIIGQFLVLLQIVKLWEQRANRDFAQLLVLSLLLMVAAAISTYSLVFGIMFVVYLFLSLYCCLLFHLKVETDHARQAIGVPEERLNPATLRQDQRYLSRSMRRLTGLVASFAVTTSVITFLFFPRGAGAGLLGQFQWQPSQALTGFSETVAFENLARITQNEEQVAWVKLTRGGQPYQPGILLLRGLTLDTYSGKGNQWGDKAYQWTRNISSQQTDEDAVSRNEWKYFDRGSNLGADDIHQQINLKPTGTRVLFAIAGVTAFRPDAYCQVSYSAQDQVILLSETLSRDISYEVRSRGRLRSRGPVRAPGTRNIDPKIEEFARNPEVSGSNAAGALASQRIRNRPVTEFDAAIARNIETYLRSNYAYTLDLTDATRDAKTDPMVAFLYDLKRGHCEYFAGAMTLLCQSLGMQARMVVGFKCDEYNTLGNFFIVKQLHAHAWVEVLTDENVWETFDPTSSREAAATRRDTLLQQARNIFNFLEYTWANSVIAYDQSSRNNLISRVDNSLRDTADQSGQALDGAMDWLSNKRAMISSNVLIALIACMIVVMIASVLWFVWEQWRLRRRARRIGLDSLPASEKIQLARQLGFYDDLMRLLERHRIVRPAHLTPLEFSNALTYVPIDAFDAIRRLTDTFYRVRFGREQLTGDQRRQLSSVIDDIDTSLKSC
jgi:transglutaminase-like putative cysteine protease